MDYTQEKKSCLGLCDIHPNGLSSFLNFSLRAEISFLYFSSLLLDAIAKLANCSIWHHIKGHTSYNPVP
jgi:hypothetical protein